MNIYSVYSSYGRLWRFSAIWPVSLASIAISPTDAARVQAGCSGDNLGKTETMIENMADGGGKIAAQQEIAAAQEALLNGKAGVCAAHLSKAMQAGTVK